MKKIIILLVILVCTLSLSATTYTYNYTAAWPYNWTNAANWSPSYPGTTINVGDSVIIEGIGNAYNQLEITQGNVIINGTLLIEYYGATLELRGNASLTIGTTGKVVNNWWFHAYNQSQIEVYGVLEAMSTNGSGTYLRDSSQMTIHAGGQFNLTDTFGVSPAATLTVNGIFTNDGNIWNDGTINGTGSITSGNTNANGVISGSGTVAPGLSPGELKTDFDYQLSASGKLEIELGGLIPGTEYDVLGGTGNKKLSGTLNVLLYNNYTPSIGQTYTIVEGAAITDTFTTVNYPALPNNMFWDLEYQPTKVLLRINDATSVAETTPINKLRIYPNPTSGKLTIEGLGAGEYQYNVYTVAGKKIESGTIENHKINLTSVTNQLLFIEVVDSNNNRMIKSINLLQ